MSRSGDNVRTIWHAWRVIRTAWRWRKHPGPIQAAVDDVRAMVLRGEVRNGWPTLALMADRMGDDGMWWWSRWRMRWRNERHVRRMVREIRRGRR